MANFSTDAFYLGNLSLVQPNEPGLESGADSSLIYGTYGSASDPIYSDVVNVTSFNDGAADGQEQQSRCCAVRSPLTPNNELEKPMYLKLPLLVASVAALSGCVSPENYETVPVVVETPQGPVTCQLYNLNRVSWDRAIDRPDSMGVTQADDYCIAEGKRRLADG
jgi:hypothetical protein